MRKSTLIGIVLTAVCVAVLFHTSQLVNDGRDRISRTEAEIRRERESIRVLTAEWSYLNQPQRLEKLSREFLDLEPMKGAQFAKAGAAPRPAPKAATEAPSPAVIEDAPPAISDAQGLSAMPGMETPPETATAKAAPAALPRPRPDKPVKILKAAEAPRLVKPSKPKTQAANKAKPQSPAAKIAAKSPKPPAKVKSSPYARTLSAQAPRKPAAKTAQARPAGQRGFNDVMKSLGVD